MKDGTEIIHFNNVEPAMNNHEWTPSWLCITSPKFGTGGLHSTRDANDELTTLGEFSKEMGYNIDLIREAIELVGISSAYDRMSQARIYDYDELLEVTDKAGLPYTWQSIDGFAKANLITDKFVHELLPKFPPEMIHRYKQYTFINPSLGSFAAHAARDKRLARIQEMKEQAKEYKRIRVMDKPRVSKGESSKARYATAISEALEKGYFNLKDSANYLGISEKSFREYMAHGLIKPVEYHKLQMRFYSKESLDNLYPISSGYSINRTIKYLHINARKVIAGMKDGTFPFVRLGKKRICILGPAVERYKEQHRAVALER